MSANPHANGGLLRKALRMPDLQGLCQLPLPNRARPRPRIPVHWVDFCATSCAITCTTSACSARTKTASNKLDAIYEVSKKIWLADYLPEDADGGELAPDGRVMEMLSEHTLEGWLEGYLLTGRHGFFSTYEAFVHVIDSMFNQHAKWLAMLPSVSWRAPVSSLNLLITSTVWRQDHNGFTHQDPGFLDVVVNKSPDVTPHLSAARRELPAVRRRSLPEEHQLHQRHRLATSRSICNFSTWMQPVALHQRDRHLALGEQRSRVSSRMWSSPPPATSRPRKPRRPSSCCARISPTSKIRFINVVDLFKLTPASEHPHGLSRPGLR